MNKLTLAVLAEAKKLPVDFLQELGVYDNNRGNNKGVGIPYLGTGGEQLAVRTRIALKGDRFRWRAVDKVQLYGLNRLEEIKEAGWVLIVEGESDCWTAWHCGLPALGVPGKSIWKNEWARFLQNVEVYVWQEPGAEGFVRRIAKSLPDTLQVVAPADAEDISDAHIKGIDVVTLLEKLKSEARPAREIISKQEEKDGLQKMEEARVNAQSIFEADDIMELVGTALRRQGLGGDIKPALNLYLAATSRLLVARRGSMPAHTILLGAASIGKSYYLGTVTSTLPPEAFCIIDAGSPRSLIYSDAELKHRVLIYSEADSLPAGEDNPAASAVRNLLQDHYLHYDVPERDPGTGQFKTRHIVKAGPTVLITTACRSLGHQLMTRLFVLRLPDDHNQQCQALLAQARLETGEARTDRETALIAFQEYLQAQAPFDVSVPFAENLAKHISRHPSAPRLMRDFARLLAQIKAVSILYSHRRQRNERNQIVAEVQDYEVAYHLVADVFEASSADAGKATRETVEAVEGLLKEHGLLKPITKGDVAEKLKLHKSSAGKRVNKCIKGGWLINESEDGKPANLKLGAPLPDTGGLPTPSELEASIAQPNESAYWHEESSTGCAVAPLTDTYKG